MINTITPASGFEPEAEAPQASRISKLPHAGKFHDYKPPIITIIITYFNLTNDNYTIIKCFSIYHLIKTTPKTLRPSHTTNSNIIHI